MRRYYRKSRGDKRALREASRLVARMVSWMPPFPSKGSSHMSTPENRVAAQHLCWVDIDPDDGTPGHYRPCPADLCEAERLHEELIDLRRNLERA